MWQNGVVFETQEPGGSLIGEDVNRELCRKQKVCRETQLFETRRCVCPNVLV